MIVWRVKREDYQNSELFCAAVLPGKRAILK